MVRKTSALLHGITSKHKFDFYCLHYLHSWTENKPQPHEKVHKYKYFIVMPSIKDNILKFNQYMKSRGMPCIICADLESLIKKITGCTKIIQQK